MEICYMKVNHTPSLAYPLLVDALRLLPNIRPVCERHRLGEAKLCASLSRDPTASINGVSVTLIELEELFLGNGDRGPRISQAGAALLVRLFEQGAFDAGESRPVEGGLELLTQYSKGLATLLGSNFWPRARRQAGSHRRKDEIRVPVTDTPIARVNHWSNVTVHRLI
jgi:hypothetical protein